MKPYLFLFLLPLLLACKKKEDSSSTPACVLPSRLNFRTLVYTDVAGNRFLNTIDPSFNDTGDDWKTDKSIPCYFFQQMDTAHIVLDDSSTTADSVYSIYEYPNPIATGFYLHVKAKKPMLMHLLFVKEDGTVVHKENLFIGSYESFREEGIAPPETPPGYFGQKYFNASSLSTEKGPIYFRLYYYFSTKYNRRFGEGYGDLYLDKDFPDK